MWCGNSAAVHCIERMTDGVKVNGGGFGLSAVFVYQARGCLCLAFRRVSWPC